MLHEQQYDIPEPEVNQRRVQANSQNSQNPAFSSETHMQNVQNNQTQSQGLRQVAVHLDEESQKILNNASAVFGESIINLGIKLVALTPAYQNLMLKDEFKLEDKEEVDIDTMQMNVTQQTQSNQFAQTSQNNQSTQSTQSVQQTQPTDNSSNKATFASW